MATKNQIASTIWIMKRIPIVWAKSHKQICLENFWQERVGMILKLWPFSSEITQKGQARPPCWTTNSAGWSLPFWFIFRHGIEEHKPPRQILHWWKLHPMYHKSTSSEGETWPPPGKLWPGVWNAYLSDCLVVWLENGKLQQISADYVREKRGLSPELVEKDREWPISPLTEANDKK